MVCDSSQREAQLEGFHRRRFSEGNLVVRFQYGIDEIRFGRLLNPLHQGSLGTRARRGRGLPVLRKRLVFIICPFDCSLL